MKSVVWEEVVMPKIDIKDQELGIKDLPDIWNAYADAGYENIYWMSFFKEIQQTLEYLFVPAPGSIVLDAGCGAGPMFLSICRKIWPRKLVAADWSKNMLKRAEQTASKLINPVLEHFDFERVDLTKKLPWPDNRFDAVVSNLVIYYLAGPGWPHAVSEFCRVVKPGGYLYISTLLAGHDLGVLIKAKRWKLETLLHSPLGFLGLFYGLKLKKYPKLIEEVLQKEGIDYPDYNDLIKLLRDLGAEEFQERPILWEAGVALRAKMRKTNNAG